MAQSFQKKKNLKLILKTINLSMVSMEKKRKYLNMFFIISLTFLVIAIITINIVVNFF